MTTQLTPSIGAKGIWAADAPYASVLVPDVIYECVAVRKLADIIAAGEDGFAKYYSGFGLTVTEYINDVQLGVCIVSLLSGTGQWSYIPHTRLAVAPDVAGVKYSRIVMGIQLGELPESMDLSPLSGVIQSAVQHYLGIAPVINLSVTSETTLVTAAEHVNRTATISAVRSLNKTDYTKNVELIAEIQSLRARLTIAEQYILANP
jgi:hypothetical protein